MAGGDVSPDVMKTLTLALMVGLAGASPALAQLDGARVVRDAAIGAAAGAIIGGHNGDRWLEGAVVGGAVGAVVGATIDQPQRSRTVVVTRLAPRVVVQIRPTRRVVVVDRPATSVVYVAAPRTRVVACSPAPAVVVVSGSCAHGWHHRHRGCHVW